MLTCLLIVFLIEPTDEFLKYRPNRMVVEAGVLDRSVAIQDRIGAQINVRREELLNEGTKCIGFR